MRLPIVPQISTKDGTTNKNARLTNCLKEVTKLGEKAVVRPGLVLDSTYTGIGNGLIPFDGRLLVIYDDTVYDTEIDDSLPWPLDSLPWSATITYSVNDVVFCSGVMKFSMQNDNLNNACSDTTGVYWRTSKARDTYDPSESYDIGDSVVVDGVTYYSYVASNTGNTPSGSSDFWETTPPGVTRYQGAITTGGSYSGSLAASTGGAAASVIALFPYTICSSTYLGKFWTGAAVRGSAPYWIDATQFQGDCGFSVNQGLVSIGIVSVIP